VQLRGQTFPRRFNGLEVFHFLDVQQFARKNGKVSSEKHNQTFWQRIKTMQKESLNPSILHRPFGFVM